MRWRSAVLHLVVVLAGCGPSVDSGDGAAKTSSGTSRGTQNSTGTSSTSSVPPSGPDSAFLVNPDGGIVESCFYFPCSEGYKCTAQGSPEIGWCCERCVPVVPDPRVVGEACTVESSALSGLDDCDAASLCWNVDPDTGQGTCVAYCEQECANADLHCAEVNFFYLCLPACDPIAQDCPPAAGCYPDRRGFSCIPRYFGSVGAGEACQDPTMCEPGLTCQRSDLLPSCDGNRCCTSYCSVSSNDCADPVEDCVPVHSRPMQGEEDIGYCGLAKATEPTGE